MNNYLSIVGVGVLLSCGDGDSAELLMVSDNL